MYSLHNKIINFEDIDEHLPNRIDLVDQNLREQVNDIIRNKSKLLFMPNSLYDSKNMQDRKYAKSTYKIVLFGIFEDGRKATVIIDNIFPYFEIKIPENIKGDDELEKFGEEMLNLLTMDGENDYDEWIRITGDLKRKNMKYFKIEPIEYEITWGKPFKYYREKEIPYLRIYFNKLGNSQTQRRAAIKLVRSKGYETAHDDISCYYRVVCRDYRISFSSWIELNKYKFESCGTNNYINDSVFRINIDNISVYNSDNDNRQHIQKDNIMTMCWDIETYNTTKDGKVPLPVKKIAKTAKDIEEPNWDHKMFMIGITFQWYNSSDQLLRICLVDHPGNPHPDFLTVACHNEKNLIKAFGKCFKYLRPDIVMGFNDAGYDWPWVIKRARDSQVLSYFYNQINVMKHNEQPDTKSIMYNYRSLQIKIEADVNAKGHNFQLPGYIAIDVMICFRQIYPTSEKWSLNFFLEKNKLGGKVDMPYQEMFDIYEAISSTDIPSNELKDKMKLVAEYCVIDSQRCHELLKIRSVIQDRREVAKLSFTSVFDAFYRANGMKVRNLVIARGNLLNLKFSNISNDVIEPGKYPGAYVFPPIKGLVTSKLSIDECVEKGNKDFENYSNWKDMPRSTIKDYQQFIAEYGSCYGNLTEELQEFLKDKPNLLQFMKQNTGRPITGLDFSSLYPSLIMTYNLSPEYMIIDKPFAKKMNKKHNLHKVKFEYNGRTIRGWSIRHDNKLDPNSPDYKFGLFPAILKELFDTRKQLKKGEKGLLYWEHVIEQMQITPEKGIEKQQEMIEEYTEILNDLKDDDLDNDILENIKEYENKIKKCESKIIEYEKEIEYLKSLSDEERYELNKKQQEDFEKAKFEFDKINSKQLALKVFMNTFYGEAGNKRSPLFMLQIAGGITTAGQYNIKSAHKYVEDHGCKVYYGDSDSLYVSMPEIAFAELDKQYYSGQMSKMKYWKKMIRKTFKEIKIINKGVNDWFVQDNGTHFLKMAYEESLFPVLFAAKKKYVGIPHISEPNFTIDDKHPLFVRGLALKTRGVSGILKQVCNDILKTCMNVDNILTVREVVKNKIEEIYTRDWFETDETFNLFVMTDVYKPNKMNIKMHIFKDRMLAERGIELKPGIRLQYVVIKKYPYRFDERGRKIPLKVGDFMELADIAKKEKMPIDLDYYVTKKIIGQLARFITYHGDFQVAIQDPNDDDEVKKAELTILKNARKYIENYAEQYYSVYINKGPVYKDIFRISSKVMYNKLYNNFDKNIKPTIKLLTYGVNLEEEFDLWFKERMEKDVKAKKYNKKYGEIYIESKLQDLTTEDRNLKIKILQKSYYGRRKKSIQYKSEQLYNEKQLELEKSFMKNISDIKRVFNLNNSMIKKISDYLKDISNIDEIMNEAQSNNNSKNNDNIEYVVIKDEKLSFESIKKKSNINDAEINDVINSIAEEEFNEKKEEMIKYLSNLKTTQVNLMSNYEFIYQVNSIVDYLQKLKDKKLGVIKRPKEKNIKNEIDKFIDSSVKLTLGDLENLEGF